MKFFEKNRFKMCVNFTAPDFPGDEFSVNIPECIADGGSHKITFSVFQPEWRYERQDSDAGPGRLSYSHVAPGRIAHSVLIRHGPRDIDFTVTARNLEDRPWKAAHCFPCLNLSESKVFCDFELTRTFMITENGPLALSKTVRRKPKSGRPMQYYVIGNSVPKWLASSDLLSPDKAAAQCIYTLSPDGSWVVGMASAQATHLFSNIEHSCIHACPSFGEIAPGEEKKAIGKIYFVRGGARDFLARCREELGVEV